MIVKLSESPVEGKRLRAVVKTDKGLKTFDFGQDGGYTFVDGASHAARENYLKRHKANFIEKTLITKLVPSPSLLSAMILWGRSRSVDTNVKHLNQLWKNSIE